MPNIQTIEGQALFDTTLSRRPLHEIWDEAEQFEADSPYEAMRYYGPDNLLVREYFEADLDTGPEDTEEAIDVSEKHLRLLTSMGLTVIKHCVEPAPADTSVVVPGLGHAKAYGASPFISGAIRLDQKQAHAIVSITKINEGILEPVYSYVQWCLKNHAPYILDDIFNARQYSLHPASGTVYLHDFDPILSPLSLKDKSKDLTMSIFNARTARH